MKKIERMFFSLAFLLWLVLLASAFGQVSLIRISAETNVDQKGDLHMDLRWRIPTDSIYTEIKRNYPNAYMILREFLPRRANREAVNTKVEYDDLQRTLRLTTDFLGSAVNKKGRWEIYLG